MKEIVVKNGIKKVTFTLPTSISEITPEYLLGITNDIEIADNYSLIGLVLIEKPSVVVTTINGSNKQAKSPVIPIMIKSGTTDNNFIKGINTRDILTIAETDIMTGLHISCPKNTLNMTRFAEQYKSDGKAMANLLNLNDKCCFLSFKIVPNCVIKSFINSKVKAEIKQEFMKEELEKE